LLKFLQSVVPQLQENSAGGWGNLPISGTNFDMPYITRDDILTKISNSELDQFTDDDGDGVADPGVLDMVIGIASNAADAYVASIYATPFTTYVPSKIKDATLIFACEMLFQRRLAPKEQNTFKPQADLWREVLRTIGTGAVPLDANVQRLVTPGFGIVYDSLLSVDPITGNPVTLM
jgi:phage gp36-like protein